jgi:2-dehydro-3-deoxy-D-gluconate 5-dehydrogenase
MVNFSLKGKTAIVTGGAQGLCNGMAQAFHDAGAIVCLVDVSDKVKDAAALMNTEDAPVYYAQGDLTDTDKLPALVDECEKKLGGHIDILLNGAGIQFRCVAEDFPADRWNSIININLSSVFFMAQAVGRKMLAQGHGKIINIASMCSFFGSTMIPAYTASKGGVAQLTKALSNEWAGRGVSVNAIAPGYMATKLTENMKEVNPKGYAEITGRIPMGRWGHPEDLEGIAVFLASEASAYISGAVIPVDGGYLGK